MSICNTMGIDFGIINPAVCYVKETKNVAFFGDAREYFDYKNVKIILQNQRRANKSEADNILKKIVIFERKIKNWRQNLITEIVDFAKKEKVRLIKVEDLQVHKAISFHTCNICGHIHKKLRNIHKRKINPVYEYYCTVCGFLNVVLTKEERHRYAFWAVGTLIGKLMHRCETDGIRVIRVDHYNSSKQCPKCGSLNRTETRKYKCSCGYENNRDVVAAINIANRGKE